MDVFIHGWGFDDTIFKEDGFKLLLPGHKNNILSLQEALSIYKLQLSKYNYINITGWSMGASLGIMLTKYLDNIKSLKLIGFSPYFKQAHTPSTFLAFIRRFKKDFEGAMDEFRKNAYPFEFTAPYPEKDIALFILEEYYELDLRNMLKNVNIPITIFQGKNDEITPISEAYKSKELNPNINLIIYEGGHFPKSS